VGILHAKFQPSSFNGVGGGDRLRIKNLAPKFGVGIGVTGLGLALESALSPT